jgi:hypothetical protein
MFIAEGKSVGLKGKVKAVFMHPMNAYGGSDTQFHSFLMYCLYL